MQNPTDDLNLESLLDTDKVDYAGFWLRFFAALIDGFIVCLPLLFLQAVLPWIGPILFSLLYQPVLESSPARATIGKRFMSIQVVTLTQGQISYRQALIRYFLSSVSEMILCIGHFFFFFTERKQTLHDLLAQTIVVQGQRDIPIRTAWITQLRSLFK